MKKFFGVLAASAMLAFGSASAFAQSGPAGDWTLAMATPQGTTNVALSLKVAGDKVTGEMNSPMGPVAVAGTAAGNDINVTADIAIQGMALTFVIGFPLLLPECEGSGRGGADSGRRRWWTG